MSTVNRSRFRRHVCNELRRVRSYRNALRKNERMSARERERIVTWIRIADETLESLRSEPDGKNKSRFFDDLYGLTRRSSGNARYVYTRSEELFSMSWSGLERWRENGVFIASILSIQYGMIDLSSEM